MQKTLLGLLILGLFLVLSGVDLKNLTVRQDKPTNIIQLPAQSSQSTCLQNPVGCHKQINSAFEINHLDEALRLSLELCNANDKDGCAQAGRAYIMLGQFQNAYGFGYKHCMENQLGVGCLVAAMAQDKMGNQQHGLYFYNRACQMGVSMACKVSNGEKTAAPIVQTTKPAAGVLPASMILDSVEAEMKRIGQFMKRFQTTHVSTSEMLSFSQKCISELSQVPQSFEIVDRTKGSPEAIEITLTSAKELAAAGIEFCTVIKDSASNPGMYQRLKTVRLPASFN